MWSAAAIFGVSRSIWQAADEPPYVYFRANNDLRQPTRGGHRKMWPGCGLFRACMRQKTEH